MIRRPHLPVVDLAEAAVHPVSTTNLVWPCADAEDVAAMQRIADLFGRPLVWGSAATGAPEKPRGVIAGLGAVGDVGQLYATLTGRRFAAAPTAAAAASDPAVDVVMCIGAQAPHDLLDALTHCGRNLDVGILWAPDRVSLRRQVLVRSAAATLEPAPGTVIVVSPLTNAPVTTLEHLPASSPTPAMLAVTTHSDGIDAFLGPMATICAVIDADRAATDLRPAPKCILTGRCHRHDMTIRQALEHTRLVSARHLAARVLVWNACLGIMSDRDGASGGWGLLQQFVSSPSVGAVLITRGIVFTTPGSITALVDSLNRGQPVRSALHEFARTVGVTSQAMMRDRMFLFGDPATVAQPANLDVPPLRAAVPAFTPAAYHACGHGDAALADHFLLGRTDENRRPDAGESPAGGTDRWSSAPAKLCPRIVAAIAAATWSAWTEAWLSHATLLGEQPRRSCAICRGAVWSGIFQPAAQGSEPRHFSNCARCGATDDHPVSRDVQVEATAEGLRLRHGGPTANWAGAIVSAPVGDPPIWCPWPARPDGRPAPIAYAHRGEQPGPVFRLAIFVEGDKVSLHMRRVYIEPAADSLPRATQRG